MTLITPTPPTDMIGRVRESSPERIGMSQSMAVSVACIHTTVCELGACMKSCQPLVAPLRTADPNQPCCVQKNPNNIHVGGTSDTHHVEGTSGVFDCDHVRALVVDVCNCGRGHCDSSSPRNVVEDDRQANLHEHPDISFAATIGQPAFGRTASTALK